MVKLRPDEKVIQITGVRFADDTAGIVALTTEGRILTCEHLFDGAVGGHWVETPLPEKETSSLETL